MSMPTVDQIMIRVQDIVRTAVADPDLVLTRTTTAKHVAGWDSIMDIMIILEVEKGFGIKTRSLTPCTTWQNTLTLRRRAQTRTRIT